MYTRMGDFRPRRMVVFLLMAVVLGGLTLIALEKSGPAAAAKSKKQPKPQSYGPQSSHESSIPLLYPAKTTKKVVCPKGQYIGWGGFKLPKTNWTGLGASSFPDGSGPSKGKNNDWNVTAHNRSAIYPDRLHTIAYCNKGPKPTVKRTVKTINPSTFARPIVASCGKQILIGGGWQSDAVPAAVDKSSDNHGELVLVSMQRTSKNAWTVAVVNEKERAVKVTAIAICGSGPVPLEVDKTISVPQDTPVVADTTAYCPQGKKVLFGGIRGDYDFLAGSATFPLSLYRAGTTSVSVSAMGNLGGADDPGSLSALAYCR